MKKGTVLSRLDIFKINRGENYTQKPPADLNLRFWKPWYNKIIRISILHINLSLKEGMEVDHYKEIYKIITILSHELKDVWVKQTYFSQSDIL